MKTISMNCLKILNRAVCTLSVKIDSTFEIYKISSFQTYYYTSIIYEIAPFQ